MSAEMMTAGTGLERKAVQEVMGLLASDVVWATQLRLDPFSLPAGISALEGTGLMVGNRLQVAICADVDQQEINPVMVDSAGRAHPRPTSVLLEMTPAKAETAFLSVSG